MIGIIFEIEGDYIMVRIDGNSVTFSSTTFFDRYTDISGLRLNYEGVIKSHPDLKDNENWKEEVIKRFKEKVKSFNNELMTSQYIIEELKPHGYKPMKTERSGFRTRKGGFKDGSID